jgi:methyl-accepting chemotaxis protein
MKLALRRPQLSIRAKTIAIFSTLFGAALLMCAAILYITSRTHTTVTELTTESFAQVGKMDELSQLIAERRDLEMRHVLSGDPKRMETYETGMKAAEAKIDGLFNDLREHRDDGMETRALALLRDTYQAYLKSSAEAVAASRAGNKVGARDIVIGQGEMRSLALQTSMKTLNTVHGKEVSNASAEINALESQLVFAVGVSAAVLAIVIVLAATFVFAGVLRPIERIGASIRKLAENDYATPVPFVARRDEIGVMARSVDVLKRNSQEREALQATINASQAEQVARVERVAALVASYEQQARSGLGAVAAASNQLDQSARVLGTAADQTRQEAAIGASAATETAANVGSVSAATQEMAASIGEVNRQVARASRIAGEASDQAAQTSTVVGELAKAAQRIGDVVNLISTIAEQTNLLALNATIEAARAGDAGRGFAVVAQEVKTLAAQTASATADITGQIAAIQSATAGATEAISGIGVTIAQLNEISLGIASAVEQQNGSTAEIARNVGEAARGTEQVSETIVRVLDAASATDGSAAEFLRASASLATQASQLEQDLGRFLKDLRAA